MLPRLEVDVNDSVLPSPVTLELGFRRAHGSSPQLVVHSETRRRGNTDVRVVGLEHDFNSVLFNGPMFKKKNVLSLKILQLVTASRFRKLPRKGPEVHGVEPEA